MLVCRRAKLNFTWQTYVVLFVLWLRIVFATRRSNITACTCENCCFAASRCMCLHVNRKVLESRRCACLNSWCSLCTLITFDILNYNFHFVVGSIWFSFESQEHGVICSCDVRCKVAVELFDIGRWLPVCFRWEVKLLICSASVALPFLCITLCFLYVVVCYMLIHLFVLFCEIASMLLLHLSIKIDSS